MTSDAAVQALLKKQLEEYRQHLNRVNQLQSATSLQQNIKRYRTIPKRFLPSAYLSYPHSGGAALSQAFKQKYNDLFFEYLSEVITQNTVVLELEIGRLRSIIQKTEKHLTSLALPLKDISRALRAFPAPNQDASNQEIEVQRITPQKRRKNHKQPNNQKKSKLTATPNYHKTTPSQHFLSKRSLHQQHSSQFQHVSPNSRRNSTSRQRFIVLPVPKCLT